MISDCPDPVEVTDFHFHQLRTLRLIKGNEKVSNASVNIVAAASKFGLLFVGFEGGFKVLKFEDVLHLDENKENRSIEENFFCVTVECPTPIILSLNESQQILAVCSLSQVGSTFSFYDVSTFGNQESRWLPCFAIPPKSAAVVRDFIWNPANENLFAYCLSDGSLHIEMISGGTVKPGASLASANATSACWSPKGKQLVVGRSDGCFTQYKPSLQEVKTVAPPQLEGNAVFVSSICWISNTQFAVVYVAQNFPYLYLVSTLKDSPVTYTNYYDICLGNNSSPNQKYFLHLEPSWGILICGSVDSIEVAVLGNMPNWVQWDLKEDGKALMPGKDGASHPVGLAVMYCAQKPIIISEIESYTPMPVIFFMTDNGLLVSFHIINSKADAASLVYPPLIQEIRKTEEINSSAAEPERIVLKRSSSSAIQPVSSFAPTTSPMNSTYSVDTTQLPQTSTFIVTKPVATDQPFKNQTSQPGFISTPTTVQDNTLLKSNEKKSPDMTEASQPAQNLSRPWETTTVKPSSVSTLKKKSDVQSSMDSSCIAAILSEMHSFSKELEEMKQLQNTIPSMDNLDDMTTLKVFALNLQNFQKDITENLQSLSRKSHALKNVILECFMTVEEASSRDRRKNDHSYITLLKERSLNPATAKHMAKINQHYQYLNTQLIEVNNKLDQDWINLLSNKKETIRKNANISSTEAIYKTFVNNQKIIHNLRKRVDTLIQKAEEKKLKTVSKGNGWRRYQKRTNNEDLSKLADEFLQLKFTAQEEHDHLPTRKLSFESQNFLKGYLKNMTVVTVRPTAVYLPPQSRLLSNANFSENSALDSQDKNTSQCQFNVSVEASDVQPVSSDAVLPKTPTSLSISFENSRNESIVSPSGTTILKEKNTSIPEAGMIITSTPNVSTFKQNGPKSQGTSLTGSPETTSGNIPRTLFKESFSQIDSSKTPETTVFPKTHSPSVPKSLENTTSFSTINPSVFSVSLKTSQPVSSTELVVTDVPSQISSTANSNLNKPTLVANVFTPAPVQGTTKSLVTSEGSAFKSQEPTKSVFPSFSFGSQPNTFTPATTKVTQTFPSFTVPENKSVFNLQGSENKSLAQMAPRIPAAANSDFSIQSSAKKDDSWVSLASTVMDSPSVMSSSPDRVIVVDTKTPSNPQVLNVNTSKQCQVIDNTFNQITITPLPQTGEPLVKSNTVDNIPNTSVSSQNLNTAATNSSIPVTTSGLVFSTPDASVPSTIITETTAAAKTITITASSSVTTDISVVSQPTAASKPAAGISTTANTPKFSEAAIASTLPVTTTTSSNTIVSDAAAPTPVFGSQPTSQTAAETPTLFGQPATVQTTPIFGQAVSSSGFVQAPSSGGFFSQTPTFGAGGNIATSSASTTSFAFGKPAFASAQTSGSFGLASSVFGQTTTAFTQPTSPASNFSFGQSSNNNTSSIFGQGSFFTGLGGKPSEENANKNVFGLTSNFKSSSENNNLFGNTTTPVFGAKSGTFGGGSFSSSGGSVAQTGFGSFQQGTPQKTGGFGFGSAPTFGNPPAFGSPPTFGSGNPLSSVFGQQQPQTNFSNFASASSPTFGSLASQTPTFGSTSPVSGFGTFGQSSPQFGGQPSSFGNPSSSSSSSSAFTQWRN